MRLAPIVAVLALVSSVATAQPQWRLASPPGARMLAIAQSSTDPRTLYASTALGAVLRSEDGGESWSKARSPENGALALELLVSPDDSRTVFALTSTTHLLRSRNGARSWETLDGEDLPGVWSIALDPRGSQALYAGTSRGLFHSDDGGSSWMPVAGLQSEGFEAIAVDPTDARHLLAVTEVRIGDQRCPHTRIRRSEDQGATWSLIRDRGQDCFPGGPVFVFDRVRPGAVYLLFRPNEFHEVLFERSLNGGRTWMPVVSDVEPVWDLASGPDGRLFAGTEGGVAVSADLGLTWTPPLASVWERSARPYDAIWRLLVWSGTRSKLLAAGASGVWISGPNGSVWHEANAGIAGVPVTSVVAATTGVPTVLAISGQSFLNPAAAVYGSGDAGATWSRLHRSLKGLQPDRLLAIDRADVRTAYGVASDGIDDQFVTSKDGGRSWTDVGLRAIGDLSITGFALDPHAPRTLLVGLFDFTLHVGGTDSLVRSSDGGVTWTYLSRIENLQALAIDPTDSAHVFGLSCGSLSVSNDGGKSWRIAGGGLPADMCGEAGEPPALALASPATVGIASEAGVFISSDGGTTFLQAGVERYPYSRTLSLVADPAEPGAFYLGAGGRGVFRWDPQNDQWSVLDAGLPRQDFDGVIVLDPQPTSRLFAATRRGLFRLDLSEVPRPEAKP